MNEQVHGGMDAGSGEQLPGAAGQSAAGLTEGTAIGAPAGGTPAAWTTSAAAPANDVPNAGSLTPGAPVTVPPASAAAWQRVSSSYAWVDLALNLLWTVAAAIVYVVILVGPGERAPLPLRIALPILIVVLFVSALFAFRRVRAMGYLLREDDLVFRRGIMFERVVAVPYGRLQLVDVTRGPLLRMLGLATLKFVTASAATGVQLPGLRLDDAEQLRDRLIELAETRRSGL